MEIHQELYTGRGVIKVKTLRDVQKVIPRTVALDFTKYTSVLYIDKYPMVFRSIALRDAAHEKIKQQKYEVTLELDEFFESNIPFDKMVDILHRKKYNLIKSLRYNINMMLAFHSFDKRDLAKKLPAFELLSNTQYISIITGDSKPSFTDEQIHRFSKTLIFPKEFHTIMRPSDFWTALHELYTSKSAKP
jgi:hypothetical protein